MSELTVGSIGGLTVNSNVVSIPSGHQISGSILNTYPGAIIKAGHYNTGYGAGAQNVKNTQTWETVNLNGTNQSGSRKTGEPNVLEFNKIHNNSHLMISVNFPYYLANGGSGFGIRCNISTDGGTSYSLVDIDTNGPAHAWGSGGYGGNDAGVFAYPWFTGDNASISSAVLSTTGNVYIYFETYVWQSADTLYLNTYESGGTWYNKFGSINIMEIAQ